MAGGQWRIVFGLAALSAIAASANGQDETAPKVYTQAAEIAPNLGQTPEAEKPPENLAELFAVGATPEWIWGADNNQSYFLRTEFTGPAKSAWLQTAVDNKGTVWINNQKVLDNEAWETADLANVTAAIQPGVNTLTIRVENAGGSAACIAKLVIQDANGTSRAVVTDGTWLAASKRNAPNGVAVRTIGKLGIKPWGDPFRRGSAPDTMRDVFELRPGFQVEKLFTVPKDELGSWVAITFDNKGRLIVSDQGDKGLCRITPAPLGSSEPTKVERLDVKISSAQGLLWAFDSLYVSVNGGIGSGLYRIRDTNGDDQLDDVVKLKEFRGGGEHGPHALRLSPDGKSIYVCAGNHTKPPFDVQTNAPPQTMGGARTEQLHGTLTEGNASRLPVNWDEDLLLRRQWDANGHATGILAPGGWVAKTDPDGKTWELFSAGYRNEYDMAFNADGELFVYDADMEWDVGTPWYRPTRVVHATSGSEFGWRSGTGKWPTSYPDSLPQLVDIGPGSPVGVEFGYGTKFPAKYQKALYVCDWTFGTMYALHIQPDGAGYKARKEEFVSRTPLPLTDVAVGQDGALYFTVGGRGTQSELFRVTYVGNESTKKVDAQDTAGLTQRVLRRTLEVHHHRAADPSKVVNAVWSYLGHPDRWMRYAARIALEHQPAEAWQARVFAEKNPEALITAAVALARQGDPSVQPPLIAALERLSWDTLNRDQRVEWLRAWELTFIRLGMPDDATAARVAKRLEPLFPSQEPIADRTLCNLLVFLKSPNVIPKTLALMAEPDTAATADLAAPLARNASYGKAIAATMANPVDLQKMHYAFALRNLKTGWTLDQRKAYFDWLQAAREKKGGNSFQGFLRNIDREAFENATEPERLAMESFGARQPYKAPELPKPTGPGKDWTLDELLAMAEQAKSGRDFKNGEKMFAAARCVVCHRFAGDGGATGPDLTQAAGRFSFKDLSEAIVDPSKVVSDQYRAVTIQTTDGKAYTGRVVAEGGDTVTMLVDPEDPTKLVTMKTADIDERVVNAVSLMPKDLLKTLNQDEVLDLMAYVLSRGNPRDGMFTGGGGNERRRPARAQRSGS
jgi:putative heme-binding domain-containing protein